MQNHLYNLILLGFGAHSSNKVLYSLLLFNPEIILKIRKYKFAKGKVLKSIQMPPTRDHYCLHISAYLSRVFYATIYPSSALSHILHMYIPKYVHLKLN